MKFSTDSQCSTLQTPEHALVASKYNGAILMYFCEPGYMLVGNAEIYCNGRQWNGTAPHCRGKFLIFIIIIILFKFIFNSNILIFQIQRQLHQLNATLKNLIYAGGNRIHGMILTGGDTILKLQVHTLEQDQRTIIHLAPEMKVCVYISNCLWYHAHCSVSINLEFSSPGYYLYIEASGRLVNDTARIISPLYNASLTNSGCFLFW